MAIKNKQAKIELLCALRQFVGRFSETAWQLVEEIIQDLERAE